MYKHKRNLTTHQKRCSKIDFSFICHQCNQHFKTAQDLNSHVDDKHSQQGGRAPIVKEDISIPNQPSTSKEQEENKKTLNDVERQSALNNTAQEITIRPINDAEKFDLLCFYNVFKSKIKSILSEYKKKFRNIKFYLNTRVRMVRQVESEEEFTIPHFRSRTFISLYDDDEEHDLNKAFQQMLNALEEFVHFVSNWRVERVMGLEIKIVPYHPLSASKYSPLPPKINILKASSTSKTRTISVSLGAFELHYIQLITTHTEYNIIYHSKTNSI